MKLSNEGGEAGFQVTIAVFVQTSLLILSLRWDSAMNEALQRRDLLNTVIRSLPVAMTKLALSRSSSLLFPKQ